MISQTLSKMKIVRISFILFGSVLFLSSYSQKLGARTILNDIYDNYGIKYSKIDTIYFIRSNTAHFIYNDTANDNVNSCLIEVASELEMRSILKKRKTIAVAFFNVENICEDFITISVLVANTNYRWFKMYQFQLRDKTSIDYIIDSSCDFSKKGNN